VHAANEATESHRHNKATQSIRLINIFQDNLKYDTCLLHHLVDIDFKQYQL